MAEGELDAGVQGDVGGLVPWQRLDNAQGTLHLRVPDPCRYAIGRPQERETVHLALGQRPFSRDGGTLGADVLEEELDKRLHPEAALQVVQLSVLPGLQHKRRVG
jgi:hypothetical protein